VLARWKEAEPCAGIPCKRIETVNRAQEGDHCSALKEFLFAEIGQCQAEDEEDDEDDSEGNLCGAWDGWSRHGYVGLGKGAREVGAVLKRCYAMDEQHLSRAAVTYEILISLPLCAAILHRCYDYQLSNKLYTLGFTIDEVGMSTVEKISRTQ
jgi:hypothetical protein